MPWRKTLASYLDEETACELMSMDTGMAAQLEEIRVRLGGKILWRFMAMSSSRGSAVTQERMDALIAALCGHARYAYEEQMALGYIPLPDGHRAGVIGRMSTGDNGCGRMSCITSVCLRIAREVHGVSKSIHSYLYTGEGRAGRVLLFGAPGCGKTTMLRDAARYLSDNIGLQTGVADERSELFACGANGCMDVLLGMKKAQAIPLLIRSMAPQVIICDEIGAEEDAQALMDAGRCGVGIVASAHADSITDIFKRPVLKHLLASGVFDFYVRLGRHGTCLGIYDRTGYALEEG